MSNLVCKDCKSTDVTKYTPGIFGDSRHRCNSCGKISFTEAFIEPTLFDRITQSPNVLAPNFVYHVTSFLDGLDKPKKIWYSTLIHNRSFETELEAKRATVTKLKEVAVCTTKSLTNSDTNSHLQTENERLKNALQKIVDLRMLNPNLKESAYPSSCSEDMFVSFYCKMGDIAVKALTNDTNDL